MIDEQYTCDQQVNIPFDAKPTIKFDKVVLISTLSFIQIQIINILIIYIENNSVVFALRIFKGLLQKTKALCSCSSDLSKRTV